MANNNPSIGVAGLLGVLFVALKLMGFIDWSWWWVTCPFWGGIALFFILLLGVPLLGVLAALFGAAVLGVLRLFRK